MFKTCPFRCLAMLLLTAVLLSQGCSGKEATPKAEQNRKTTDTRPDALRDTVQPPAGGFDGPKPPSSALPVEQVSKDTESLKAVGLTVWPREEGLTVDLSDDKITEDGRIKPELLTALKKANTVVGLNFQGASKFSDAGIADIRGFTKLRRLLLEGPKVTDVGMVHLKELTKLEEINLSDTAITDKGLASLKDLTNLTILSLGTYLFKKRDVSDAGLARLQLGKLKRLYIGGTKITDAGLALLKDSKNLEVLFANNCDTSDKGLEHLKSLAKLGWLKLENTKVTDVGLANLKAMKELFDLDLSGCKGIGNPGLAHLEALHSLTHLDVGYTAVTQDGAAKLQKKLPKCSISGGGWKLERKSG